MRIITLNANGIRAAARKGFFDWLPKQNADVICIQETKAQIDQLSDQVFHPQDYHCYYFDAEKKGYSGVALYSRVKPRKVIRGLDNEEFDREGRYIEACFANTSVVSVYLPSGSSSDERQQAKFRFLDMFMPYLKKLHRKKREYVICGKTGGEIRKTPAFCLKNAPGWMNYLAQAGLWMRFVKLTRRMTSTPGGPIEARPGRRMSVGE